jgi:hypothetical protein
MPIRREEEPCDVISLGGEAAKEISSVVGDTHPDGGSPAERRDRARGSSTALPGDPPFLPWEEEPLPACESSNRSNRSRRPTLTIEEILAWAEAYHAAHGRWPGRESGPVEQAPSETWMGIDSALKSGGRGLATKGSLARLLRENRGPETLNRPPRLTVEQVLAWADAHYAATGEWPSKYTGTVTDAPHESWQKIDNALSNGRRGLPRAGSIARLLSQHRGKRHTLALPPLTLAQIRAWAEAHRARTGRWPRRQDGPVADAPGETWWAINCALQQGKRGLPRGLTLSRLEYLPPGW